MKSMSVTSSISVVIITRDRPVAMIRQTLSALMRQTMLPTEVLVVDTSPSNAIPAMICVEFPSVKLLHLPNGPRCMPWSRNQGIKAADGEIIAFLDDDALAEPQWLAEITRTYDEDMMIGGVGGRVIEGVDLGGNPKGAGEAVATLTRQGIPRADFNSVTDRPVEIEHMIGCNMSFRRSALIEVGGFDEYYDGTAIREETDTCVRVRRAGYRLLYNSQAVVDHKMISLLTHRRVQIESVKSGFPVAQMEGYYVAKNFGVAAWLSWYLQSNFHAFARAIKITHMAFARAALGLGGGPVGLVQALKHKSNDQHNQILDIRVSTDELNTLSQKKL